MINRQPFSIRNTIFLRLLSTFLLIMLPILIFGVYLYHWIVQTASEDISKTAVSQLTFYITDLEKEVERMKLLQYSVIEDEDLNELTLTWDTMDVFKRTEKINSLRKRLYAIQNSSPYIKNVSAHIYPLSKTISSANGPSEFNTERYNGLRSELSSRNNQIVEWKGGLFLSAAKPSVTMGNQPLFIIEIELDQERLQEALSQFNTYPGSGTLLTTNKSGVILSSGSLKHLEPDVTATIEQMREAPHQSTETFTISGNRYYTAIASSGYLNMSIYRLIPEQMIKKPLDKFYIWAWLFILVAFVIIAIYAFSTYKFIHKPLLTLVKSFRRMENGDLDVNIHHESKDELGYLYGRFNQMVTNLRSLIDQVYKQKIMTQRAELKQLQSQINPHFLYNSFFILRTMAKIGDVERIGQFATQLGEYFQFVTRNASDEVLLRQEIHHARMYTEIQELRFSRRIRVQFDALPPEIEQKSVPRLIVQPIIENAFEHSLERMKRSGCVVIRFEVAESEIRIVVEDNGESLTDEALQHISDTLDNDNEQTETTGLVNIHRRVKITYGEKYGLRISRSDLGGLQATICIPLKGGDVHD
ncbi:sensor histidine kinase [Paenibacillus sp. GCM10023248]|uniref:sensor histidine kinase n=1 Tax=Bacillales TaxID=1385 RepID=UPI0023794662|nr:MULTISPECIES: histidine kinase [Bacillales]MDD9269492.1 histidine kinase [Paenibacillus sp. MAHUQ-63]MDR6880890.1 two-component system sensor histidine kinase YesM [Bacillus sp. 3255]